jgi:RND family efflux transporter MFP subunit
LHSDKGIERFIMNKKKRRFFHFGVTIALVTFGILGMRALTVSKPPLKKHTRPAPVPMVRTLKVQTGPQAIRIQGEGTVRPLREINLVPQVDGKVLHMSSALVNGGEFKKGDVLLRVDPVDYELAVTLAQANIKDGENLLELAKEEAAAAQEEWRLLHTDSSKGDRKPPPLVAKEPQLAAAQAKLEAARADLNKALLNLERTGQYVSPGQALATLYSTEAAEIVLPLEDESAFWFHVPGFTPGNGPGSPAVVRARIAGREQTWSGKVVRTEGELDERTRMINVVVRVNDPYAKKPPLAVGLFVTVEIKGRTLPKAAIIPRAALHQETVVWIVDKDSRLRFRKVDVARVQGDRAVVRAGLENGEKVIITPLKAATDGMAVRIVEVKEINRS